jgi:hypothetical protein
LSINSQLSTHEWATLDTSALTGKQGDFKAAATHLLLHDPVAKKRTSNHKRGAGEISDITGADISSFGTKEGIGKTGVHLRYHKSEEYSTLSSDQMDELREWRKSLEGRKQSKRKGKRDNSKGGDIKRVKREKAMAASITKQVEKKLAELTKQANPAASEEPSHDELTSCSFSKKRNPLWPPRK